MPGHRSEGWLAAERQRIIRAIAAECTIGPIGAAEAGVIRVIREDLRGSAVAGDSNDSRWLNCDCVTGKNSRAIAAERDVRDKVDLSITARRLQFQRSIVEIGIVRRDHDMATLDTARRRSPLQTTRRQ